MQETILGRGGDGTVSLLPCPKYAVAVKRVISIVILWLYICVIYIFVVVYLLSLVPFNALTHCWLENNSGL